jgi:hypothetical protein
VSSDTSRESQSSLRAPVIWTVVMTFLAAIVAVATNLGTCLGEENDGGSPLGYDWSPRARFCGVHEGASTTPWMYLSLLVPIAALALGRFIRTRTGSRQLALAAYALAGLAPIVPPVYVAALPSYQVGDYAILTQPWLRTATPTREARVCYVYGIATAAQTLNPAPDTQLRCVDLQRNAASEALTPSDDGGQTSYNLQFLGDALTQRGWPASDGFSGFAALTVARAYELPFSQARQGATNESG